MLRTIAGTERTGSIRNFTFDCESHRINCTSTIAYLFLKSLHAIVILYFELSEILPILVFTRNFVLLHLFFFISLLLRFLTASFFWHNFFLIRPLFSFSSLNFFVTSMIISSIFQFSFLQFLCSSFIHFLRNR